MAGGVLDRDKRVLRREGPGTTAAGQLRRVRGDDDTEDRRGVPRGYHRRRGSVPLGSDRGTPTARGQIRPDIPLEANALGEGWHPLGHDAQRG